MKISAVQSVPYRLVALCFRYEDANTRLVRYTIDQGKITSETSIVLLLGRYWYTRRHALSPDREWLYCLFHAESALINLKERKWYGSKRISLLDRGMYDFCWSPNCRFLAGVPVGGIGRRTKLVLLSVPDFRSRVLLRCRPNTYIFDFGWYPDSRRLWYTLSPVPAVSSDLKWYQITRTGSQRQLQKSEQQEVEENWGVKVRAYCSGGGVPYTKDLSMRINYEMFRWQLAWIERRDGRIFRLTPPLGEDSMPAPQDVSADKEWFLGVYYRRGSIYTAHIPTNRWERIFVLPDPDRHEIVGVGFEQSAYLLI